MGQAMSSLNPSAEQNIGVVSCWSTESNSMFTENICNATLLKTQNSPKIGVLRASPYNSKTVKCFQKHFEFIREKCITLPVNICLSSPYMLLGWALELIIHSCCGSWFLYLNKTSFLNHHI